MKKFFILSTAAIMSGALTLTSCSENDGDENNPQTQVTTPDGKSYTDKAYGQKAIDDCATVVTALENANEAIGTAQLSAGQETELRNALRGVVNNVIIPTYTNLADDVERLEATLNGLTVSTITQEQINSACDDFKKARAHWELSEAFLGGAASDFGVDPTIDSWPLNRSMLLSYFNQGSQGAISDETILGFHALEFILFRNGQPRNVTELQGKDTYKNFGNITGAEELAYAQSICKLLKERTFQLQVAWQGTNTANAARVQVVSAAGLGYTVPDTDGLSYGENLMQAGVPGSKSIIPTLKDAIAQVLSDDEGSCAAIATEVGTAKIANPFSAGDVSYVESPYSYNSITDFQDNIRSIRNVWYGSIDGNPTSTSFHSFFAANKTAVNTEVENAVNEAIASIGNMPAPFVKYVCTVWNIAFEDDEDWE